MGVIDTTPMDSGKSKEDHFEDCLAIYQDCYGRAFDFVLCYHYLQDKAKYTSYLTKLDDEEAKKKLTCPQGTKASKKALKDAQLIKQVMDSVKEAASSGDASKTGIGTSNTKSPNGFYATVGTFLETTGDVLCTFVEQQGDKEVLEYLDTPDKKALMKEQALLWMAALRNKRHKLEGLFSVPSVVGPDQNDNDSNGQNANLV